MKLPIQEPLSGTGDFSNNMKNWRKFGPARDVELIDGAVSIVSRGVGGDPTGILNDVSAGKFEEGEKLSLRWRSKISVTPGEPGFDGKIVVQEVCPSTGLKELYYNTKIRATEWVDMAGEFEAPAKTCKIRVQLMTNQREAESTTVWFDDVSLQRSDSLSEHDLIPEYDLFVWETPTNILTVKGEGEYTLQAYEDGYWSTVETFTAVKKGVEIIIPERFTGRNVNFKYHDGHLRQLRTLAYLSGNTDFADYSVRWSALSPSEPK